LTADPSGADPENVLVIEIIGSVGDFYSQILKIPGLEWIQEDAEVKAAPDDEIYYEDNPEKLIDETIYLTMANQAALQEVRRLFRMYQQNEGDFMEFGRTPWRDVFAQVRDMRFWGPEDRIRATYLVENIREELRYGVELVRIEAELWYSPDFNARLRRQESFSNSIVESNGRVIETAVIQEIRYQGVLFEVPAEIATKLLNGDLTLPFVINTAVQYLSPTGQTSSPYAPLEVPNVPAEEGDVPVGPLPSRDPLVALLDGLPLQNHIELEGRLIVDDPDDWERTYPPESRVHGTAMASLVIHGDMTQRGRPLETPLYVRPVMKPSMMAQGSLCESVPKEYIEVEKLRVVLRRMFEGENGGEPVCPTVRIINYSIGNVSIPFDRRISPVARLFDWAAWRYNVLFVVSAGNDIEPYELDIDVEQWESADGPDRTQAILRAMGKKNHQRRLLSPAESMNTLAVGSLHEDYCSTSLLPNHVYDPIDEPHIPSPISRIGGGYRRTVKPDIVVPGGRQLYRLKSFVPSRKAELKLQPSPSGPGQKVALPPVLSERNRMGYTQGTSNSAALVSRSAHEAYQFLEESGLDVDDPIYSQCLPVLTRALLVHGSTWSTQNRELRSTLAAGNGAPDLSAYLGYGSLNSGSFIKPSATRAVMVGYGVFESEGLQEYTFPIPAEFSGRTWKRISITLAWFSRVSPERSTYRNAKLGLSTSNRDINEFAGASNSETANAIASQRGTLFHTVLSGQGEREFGAESILPLGVVCTQTNETSNMGHVTYGLLVTVEAREQTDIAVHSLIAARVREMIRAQTRTRVTS
jgi:hypothetical protein